MIVYNVTDCYVAGRAIEYCGKQDVTVFNQPCGIWKQFEDGKTIIDSNFPEGSLTAASNYCRAPVNERPWCLSANGQRGADCDVPVCA